MSSRYSGRSPAPQGRMPMMRQSEMARATNDEPGNYRRQKPPTDQVFVCLMVINLVLLIVAVALVVYYFVWAGTTCVDPAPTPTGEREKKLDELCTSDKCMGGTPIALAKKPKYPKSLVISVDFTIHPFQHTIDIKNQTTTTVLIGDGLNGHAVERKNLQVIVAKTPGGMSPGGDKDKMPLFALILWCQGSPDPGDMAALTIDIIHGKGLISQNKDKTVMITATLTIKYDDAGKATEVFLAHNNYNNEHKEKKSDNLAALAADKRPYCVDRQTVGHATSYKVFRSVESPSSDTLSAAAVTRLTVKSKPPAVAT